MNISTKFVRYCFIAITLLIVGLFPCHSEAAMYLKDRLQTAEPGDYIVTAIDNTYTVLIVKEKFDHQMTLEEITIPSAQLKRLNSRWYGWRSWVESNAPGHTSWVMYTIHSTTGQMGKYFSYTRNQWSNMTEGNNFLSNLLNLRMDKINKKKMKKVGPPPVEASLDFRRIWTPKMVYEGSVIKGVEFEAWRTRWPRDGSKLANKVIIVYIPADGRKYPSYFPYWLEIHGMLGKAKVRIIDSGRNLPSPRTPPSK